MGEEEDKAIETKEYLDFPEQIIACHARHTVVSNNKIHFNFLQKRKKKKNQTKFRNLRREESAGRMTRKVGNLRH